MDIKINYQADLQDPGEYPSPRIFLQAIDRLAWQNHRLVVMVCQRRSIREKDIFGNKGASGYGGKDSITSPLTIRAKMGMTVTIL